KHKLGIGGHCRWDRGRGGLAFALKLAKEREPARCLPRVGEPRHSNVDGDGQRDNPGRRRRLSRRHGLRERLGNGSGRVFPFLEWRRRPWWLWGQRPGRRKLFGQRRHYLWLGDGAGGAWQWGRRLQSGCRWRGRRRDSSQRNGNAGGGWKNLGAW